jgi:hypothetical protein
MQFELVPYYGIFSLQYGCRQLIVMVDGMCPRISEQQVLFRSAKFVNSLILICNVMCRSLKGHIFIVSVQQVIGTEIKVTHVRFVNSSNRNYKDVK